MKCNRCNSVWTNPPTMKYMATKCPFCGAELIVPDNELTMASALRRIYDIFGNDAFMDGKKLLSLFADLAPALKKERKLLSYFLEAGGNTAILNAINSNGQVKLEIEKISHHMTTEMFISNSAAISVCEAFLSATYKNSESSNTSTNNNSDINYNIGENKDGLVEWHYDSVQKCLTIYGTGPMKEKVPASWEKFKQEIISVIIQNGVTSIARESFKDCCNLSSVAIPNSALSIGDIAFAECRSLPRLTIPCGVKSIGNFVFAGCTQLSYVSLSNTVEHIGDGAFHGCNKLESLSIPNPSTSLGEAVFCECSSLRNIALPKGLNSISGTMFSDCTNLRSITIPNNVTSIGKYSFSGCSSITEVVLPIGVKTIEEAAFWKCNSLVKVTVPESVISIGKSAFDSCSSLEEVIVPSRVDNIGEFTFSDCSSLQSISIPESVTSIGQYAFMGCDHLKTVFFGGSKSQWDKLLPWYVDRELQNAEVVFFDGAKNHEKRDQQDRGTICQLKEQSRSDNTKPPPQWGGSMDQNAFKIEYKHFRRTMTRYLGKQSYLILPDSFSVIGEGAFRGCSSLQGIMISESITKIERSAFEDCDALEAVFVLGNVLKIEPNTFAHCKKLSQVEFKDGLQEIAVHAFAGCRSLKTIYIPDSVNYISDKAFQDCGDRELEIRASSNWIALHKACIDSIKRFTMFSLKVFE